jgi:hypothetical protein
MPRSFAIVKMALRVIPSRDVPSRNGEMIMPFRTRNKFIPLPSLTRPPGPRAMASA